MTSDGVAHVPGVSGRGQDLPRLTSLRAFAALAVFLFHLARHIEWAPLRLTFAEGYVGVAFFYVLSGFVLTWSTRPSLPAREFYVRRFARVYPSHFVMLLVALLLPRLVMPVTPEALIANVLLVQAWFPQWEIAFGINSVSWSLSVEFFLAAGPSSKVAAFGVAGIIFAVCFLLAMALHEGVEKPLQRLIRDRWGKTRAHSRSSS